MVSRSVDAYRALDRAFSSLGVSWYVFEQLLSGLQVLLGQGRALLARLLGYLGEVEERRLDLELYVVSFCTFERNRWNC